MFHLKCFAIGLFILNFLCVYCNDMLKTCFISAELLLTVALIELRFIIAIIPQPFNGSSWNFQGIFLKSDIFRILQNTCFFRVFCWQIAVILISTHAAMQRIGKWIWIMHSFDSERFQFCWGTFVCSYSKCGLDGRQPSLKKRTTTTTTK